MVRTTADKWYNFEAEKTCDAHGVSARNVHRSPVQLSVDAATEISTGVWFGNRRSELMATFLPPRARHGRSRIGPEKNFVLLVDMDPPARSSSPGVHE